MEYEFRRRGCEWPAYPPIVGSGFFSTVLHYDADDQQMQDGDVVVMDVAGSYSGYAADITRTLPVNGHFTSRQREIYEIVLGAQNAAIAAARPGMSMGRGKNNLHEIAFSYINTHGKDMHGGPLGQYFIHGLGHSIGLNVHDPMNYNMPLQPGMVVTMESASRMTSSSPRMGTNCSAGACRARWKKLRSSWPGGERHSAALRLAHSSC
jgi:Xaa-Pro aminopeptidase